MGMESFRVRGSRGKVYEFDANVLHRMPDGRTTEERDCSQVWLKEREVPTDLRHGVHIPRGWSGEPEQRLQHIQQKSGHRLDTDEGVTLGPSESILTHI